MELVKQAHLRIGVYWHVFPTRVEAKDAIWRDPAMLFNIIPSQLIEKINEQELVIYFKNGSVMQLKGADDPDSLRGAGPKGVVLDEFAEMKFYAWQVLEPILRENKGWCWFIGTPRGKNHFYDMYQRGLEGHPQWKSWLLKASQSKIIPEDELAESRRTSLEAHYTQEYECEFLEGEGSVFRRVREAMTATPQPPEKGHMYVMGADLAKVTDFTAIAIYDRATNAQVYQDKFKTIEWPFQKARMTQIAKHFNNALIMVDATGIGDPIADDLMRNNLAVEPIKITEPMKKELVEKLSIYIEQKLIKLLPMEESKLEFDNFSYERGPTGKVRYGAREGFHDDIVIAHALAVWSLAPLAKEVRILDIPPVKRAFIIAKRRDEFEDKSDWDEWSQT